MKYYSQTEAIKGMHRVRGGVYRNSDSWPGCNKGYLKFTYILAETHSDYGELIQMAEEFEMKIKWVKLKQWKEGYYGLKMIVPSEHIAKVTEERGGLYYDTGEEI